MRRGGGAVAVLAYVVALVVQGSAVPDAAAEVDEEPVRIALLGDSITHGSSGDFTWRYFLDRQLQADDVDFDLVGARNDVFDLAQDDWDATTAPTGALAYQDPEFDTDHQSLWGDSVVMGGSPVDVLMAEHAPDVLVHALGFNDLTWFRRTPAQLLADVRAQVDRARTGNPNVRIVLGQVMADVSHWALFPMAEFNALLAGEAPSWGTDRSPVVVAGVPDDYRALGGDDVRDTWDGTHPDTSGQVKLAAAYGAALARVGVGSGPTLPLVMPSDGLRRESRLTVTRSGTHLRLTWTGPPGATGHDVWMAVDDAPSAEVARNVRSGYELGPVEPGHRYALRVVSRKYDQRSADDQFSPVVSVEVPTPEPTSTPTPGPGEEPSPSPSSAPAPSPTPSSTLSPGPSDTPTPTSAPGPRPSFTSTPTTTPAPSSSRMPSPTVHPTQPPVSAPAPTVPTPTPTPTPTPPPTPTPTTSRAPTVPAAPQSVRGLRLRPGDSRVLASWQPVAGAVGYRLDWRRADRPGSRRTTLLADTSVVLRSLVAGGRYRLRVRALTPAGIDAGVVASVVVRGPAVARVARVRVRADEARSVRVTWRPARHATGYRVERRTRAGWQVVRGGVRSTRVRLRLPAGTHRLRVRAVHDAWPGAASRTVAVRVRGRR